MAHLGQRKFGARRCTETSRGGLTVEKMARTALSGILAGSLLATVLLLVGCGTPAVPGGCSVNGTYYPNGNAPNGQCVCPVIGSCSISVHARLPIPQPMRLDQFAKAVKGATSMLARHTRIGSAQKRPPGAVRRP
jgi:hypothetical protein